MSMTNEQIQALKAAAESVIQAYGDDWFGTGSQICTLLKSKVNLIAAANPAVILSLLAERDADKALIAELAGYLKNAHAFIENTEAFGQEAANGILKCGGEEWNVDASKNALAAAGITLDVGE